MGQGTSAASRAGKASALALSILLAFGAPLDGLSAYAAEKAEPLAERSETAPSRLSAQVEGESKLDASTHSDPSSATAGQSSKTNEESRSEGPIRLSGAQAAADVPLSSEASKPSVGEIVQDGLVYCIVGDEAALVGWRASSLEGDIVVPALVSSGDDAYAVTAVGVEESDESDEEGVLAGSAATSLSLPESVETVFDGALSGCLSLARVSVSSKNETYASFDGMLLSKDLSNLLLVPEGKEGVAMLPDQTDIVPALAFSHCAGLSCILVGEGSTSFSSRNGLLYTKDMKALVACPPGAGDAVVIPEGVESIGPGAFAGCAVSSITVPGDVREIAPDAFDAEAKASAVVAIPAGEGHGARRAAWEAAGFSRFAEPARPGDTGGPGGPDGDGGDGGSEGGSGEAGSGLAFEVLEDYTLAASWAGGDAPASIEVPATAELGGASYRVSSVAPAGFAGLAGLESVELPAGLSTIGEAAFAGCSSLASADLPDGLAEVGERAFEACALSEAWLPASVATVGPRAFASCPSLSRVVALGSPGAAADALAECAGVSVYCPAGSEDSWNPGLPAAGNHVMPYAASLSAEPLAIAAGESADLLGGGELLAPEPVETSYSYPAKPLSVDLDGTATGKSEGSADVAVALTLDGVELARASRAVEVAPGEGPREAPAPMAGETAPPVPGAYLAAERAAAAPISVTAPVAVAFGGDAGYDVANPQASVESNAYFENNSDGPALMTEVRCAADGAEGVLEAKPGEGALASQRLFGLYPEGDPSKAVEFGYGAGVNSAAPAAEGDFKIAAGARLECTYRLDLASAQVMKSAADNGATVKPLATVSYTFELPSFYLKDAASGIVYDVAEVKAHAEDISAKGEDSPHYARYSGYVADDAKYECKTKWGGTYYDVRIIGILHDDKADASGKAGLTFQFKNLLNGKAAMNALGTNEGGWGASALRASMNGGAIWDTVPADLQKAIAPVAKKYCPTYSSTSVADLATVEDRLFVASFCELGGDVPSSYDPRWGRAKWINAEGSQYEYWKSRGVNGFESAKYAILKKGLQSSPGASEYWYERTVCPYGGNVFGLVDVSGIPGANSIASYGHGVCPCFCL